MPSALLKSRLLVLNQAIVRLFTFVGNIFIIRLVGASSFGVASVNLYLLYSAILSLGQDAVRKATLVTGYVSGSSLPHSPAARSVILARSNNTAWLSLPLSICAALVLSFMYLFIFPQPESTPDYAAAVAVHAVAAVIESLAAPLYAYAQRRALFGARVVTEAPGHVVRSAVTLVLAFFTASSADAVDKKGMAWLHMSGLMAFSWGMLSFSCFYTCAYFCYFALRIRSLPEDSKRSADNSKEGVSEDDALEFMSLSALFPHAITDEETQLVVQKVESSPSASVGASLLSSPLLQRHFDVSLLSVLPSFLLQSAAKLAVTEGGGFLLVMAGSSGLSPEELGVYSLVANLGAVPVRVVFLPLEEAGAVEFAGAWRRIRLSSTFTPYGDAKDDGSEKTATKEDGLDAKKPPSAASAIPTEERAGSCDQAAGDRDSDMPAAIGAATTAFGSLMRPVITIGGLFLALGPPLAPAVIDLLYGPAWSSGSSTGSNLTSKAHGTNGGASRALALFSAFIPALALNGISEAFDTASAATPAHIAALSRRMVACTLLGLVAGAGAAAAGLGAGGQVVAAGAVMGLRGLWALFTAGSTLRGHARAARQLGADGNNSAVVVEGWWRSGLPSKRTLTALTVAAAIGWAARWILLAPLCSLAAATSSIDDQGSGTVGLVWWGGCSNSLATLPARTRLTRDVLSLALAGMAAVVVVVCAAADAGVRVVDMVRGRRKVD